MLVTLQFTISIVLLAGTAIVYQQMAYMQTKNLGFQKEQVAAARPAASPEPPAA